ncbi:MAG: alpha-1,4-glucan--maltose-1-phosphate maltosyltransferase [Beijerinckiaceae bacterium]
MNGRVKPSLDAGSSKASGAKVPSQIGDGRVVIEAVVPELDCGDTPIKRIVGDTIDVQATIFSDGHEKIAADLLWRLEGERDWQRVRMRFIDNDLWRGTLRLEKNARYLYTIESWRDPFATWSGGLEKKRDAGQDLTLDLEHGLDLVRAAAPRMKEAQRARDAILAAADGSQESRATLLLEPRVLAFMSEHGRRDNVSRHAREFVVIADRQKAAFSAWYELFPRSQTPSARKHGTFIGVIDRLAYVRDLGFDVLYFPPIHPIGRKNRKGRNNALSASPADPGSVYAIGAKEGGHDALHPELGTMDDFLRLIKAAREHDLEIALDFAIQCSPDHPWIKQHPEWFEWLKDGSIAYAENPPKKYEDIVNVQFYGAAFPSVWLALRDVVLFWVRKGIKIFRVDNPHTKPIPFWRWLIAEINRDYPEVIFLAEAFTRPSMMRKLAKIGFQQSYTYFTWRDEKWNITEYINELMGEMAEYYRPNFFVNTPDINPIYLQTSGRPGFIVRSTLAALLSGNWGMYSGFEICESDPLPGREEYLDSEKYEIRLRDFDAPGNIKDHIRALNRIRRDHSALHGVRGTLFLNAWNDAIVAFARFTPERSEAILVIVNLDPRERQECTYEVPLWEFGLPDSGSIAVVDLLEGFHFMLHGKTHRIALDPAERSVVVWRLVPPAPEVRP